MIGTVVVGVNDMTKRTLEAQSFQDQSQSGRTVVGHITMEVVQREHVPLVRSDDGESIGAIVDMIVTERVREGKELRSFHIEFEPQDWQKQAEFYGA